MAVLFNGKGYGQIEPNRCSFLHDGNIESQCIAVTDLENGQIVKVQKAGPTTYTNAEGTLVTVECGGVTKASDLNGLIGLNYTAERIYERATGLKNFKVNAGEYPRVGYIKRGDVYTTNLVTTNMSADGIRNAIPTGLYLDVATTTLTTDGGSDEYKLQVVELTTMPDGQAAVKIQVI
jgi:hypothetical protein